MLLTARAENHIRGVDDLDDTIARLVAYREAGADALYAPGLTDLEQIARVVAAVELPLNVLILPGGPTVAELEAVGVRRVSTGSLLAGSAYGALVEAANALRADGTAPPADGHVPRDTLRAAFDCDARAGLAKLVRRLAALLARGRVLGRTDRTPLSALPASSPRNGIAPGDERIPPNPPRARPASG